MTNVSSLTDTEFKQLVETKKLKLALRYTKKYE
jgi:hypothetical protein